MTRFTKLKITLNYEFYNHLQIVLGLFMLRHIDNKYTGQKKPIVVCHIKNVQY